MQGRPSDNQSTDSAPIAMRCGRVHLFVDPQRQAEAWLRHKEAAHGLRVVPAAQPSAIRTVAHCARMGMPCLVTGVDFAINPALAPLCALADSPSPRARACTSPRKSRDAADAPVGFLGLAAPLAVRIGGSDVSVAAGFALYLAS